jgi:hypothetical protein
VLKVLGKRLQDGTFVSVRAASTPLSAYAILFTLNLGSNRILR